MKFKQQEILIGNCIDVMHQKIKKKSIQTVVTSPPYNIGKSYEIKKPLDEYLEDQKKTLIECVRVLKDKGSICWQVGTFVNKTEIIPLDILIYNSLVLLTTNMKCLKLVLLCTVKRKQCLGLPVTFFP